MAFILIYVTHADEQAAQDLVKHLVKERKIACGNCFSMKSMYWWQTAIENENEWVSILKTIPENWLICQKRIEELHPYEVPCIIKIEAEANEKYEEWIRESVGK